MLPPPSVEAQSSHLSLVCCQSPRLCFGAISVYFPNSPHFNQKSSASDPKHRHFSSEFTHAKDTGSHSTSIHLSKCTHWVSAVSHSAPWWGPLRDQGMSLHGVYRFMAFKHPPECGHFSYKIPFRRLPGAHCGFFSDSAIRCKVELFNGPWAHCCHQRRSEYKCQRVSTTELLVIAWILFMCLFFPYVLLTVFWDQVGLVS